MSDVKLLIHKKKVSPSKKKVFALETQYVLRCVSYAIFSKNKTKKGHCSENLILSASFDAISIIIKKMSEILYTKNQNADAENSLIKNCCFALGERYVRKCQKYFTFFAFFALKKTLHTIHYSKKYLFLIKLYW